MNLDRLVVLRGAAAGLLLALPATVFNGILAEQENRSAPFSLLTVLLVLAGFGLAGFSAGHERPDDGRRHGLAAAVVTLVPVELFAITSRLGRGDGISLFTILLTAAFAVAAGSRGGTMGAHRKAGRSS